MMKLLLAVVLLVLSATFAFGGNNEVYIEQVGSDNLAAVEQNGSDNFANVSQNGNENDADISSILFCPDCQFDTLGFLQYQEGDGNEARLRIEGDDNHISQWQEGDENIANLFIKGNVNVAKQIQLGSLNESLAEIFGDYNTLCHFQEGNGWTQPLISIVGSGQAICIIQK